MGGGGLRSERGEEGGKAEEKRSSTNRIESEEGGVHNKTSTYPKGKKEKKRKVCELRNRGEGKEPS